MNIQIILCSLPCNGKESQWNFAEKKFNANNLDYTSELADYSIPAAPLTKIKKIKNIKKT